MTLKNNCHPDQSTYKASLSKNQVMLGLDWGEKRIGVAFSEQKLALAYKTVDNNAKAPNYIAKIALEKKASKIVIGMPWTLQGEKTASANKVEDFARQIQANLALLQNDIRENECGDALKAFSKRSDGSHNQIEITLVDERFSTFQASKQLFQAGKNAKKQRAVIDKEAARIILQSYLDRASGNF